MESTHPTVFVKNYEEGITRVKGGGYAFLMESTVLQYKVQVSTLWSLLQVTRNWHEKLQYEIRICQTHHTKVTSHLLLHFLHHTYIHYKN